MRSSDFMKSVEEEEEEEEEEEAEEEVLCVRSADLAGSRGLRFLSSFSFSFLSSFFLFFTHHSVHSEWQETGE